MAESPVAESPVAESAVAEASAVPTAEAGGTVTVRYYAAARAAAGIEQEQIPVSADATVATVLAGAVARHGADLDRVLAHSSVLLDGVTVHSGPAATRVTLVPGQSLDVLPPFAGG